MSKEYKVIDVNKCVEDADKERYPYIEKELNAINDITAECLKNKHLFVKNSILGGLAFLLAIVSKRSLKYVLAVISSTNVYAAIYFFSKMRELEEESLQKFSEFVKKYNEVLTSEPKERIK